MADPASPANTSGEHDLEAIGATTWMNEGGLQQSSSHLPQHHHQRTEATLSESGVTWHTKRRQWQSDDDDIDEAAMEGMRGIYGEEAREEEHAENESQTTKTGGQVTQSAATTATHSEKDVSPKTSAERFHQEKKKTPSLLTTPTVVAGDESHHKHENQSEIVWLEWEKDDRDNPYNFGPRAKWVTTWISCLYTLLVAMAGSALPISSGSMISDLHCTRWMTALALSVFPLGFGLAPLVLAPFSEAYGRYPMYVSSSIIYTAFFFGVGFAPNIETVIVSRFFGGLAASTGSTLVGGTIADLFESKDRGLPMSLFSICAFAGTGLGPALMGYVEQDVDHGWRWIQWIQLIAGAGLSLCIILFTKETRGSVILSRRAARMRKQTGDNKYQCRSDRERASLGALIRISMTRPIYLLFTEAIVFFFSLWVSFAWGILYLTLEAVPLIMVNVYGYGPGLTGLTFYTVVVASLIGGATNVYQERLYQKHVAKRGPEARLYASCVGGIVFPAGIFIFAFTQGRGSVAGPLVGLVTLFTGIFTIYLATFNYLADTYQIYASSALSGQSLCRNMAGFGFPLFTTAMYNRLGYQWASFLAGCLGTILGITPFVLMAFGPKIRARSKFSRELAKMQGN